MVSIVVKFCFWLGQQSTTQGRSTGTHLRGQNSSSPTKPSQLYFFKKIKSVLLTHTKYREDVAIGGEYMENNQIKVI